MLVGHCHLFGNDLCCKQRNCSPHSNYYSRCENCRGKQRLCPNPKQLAQVFDIIWHCLTFRMPMCPVSLVDRLMGSNIWCIDFSNRCPWLHLHTIRDDSWRFRPSDFLSLCFSWKHWWMDDDSSFAPVTMTLSPATLGLRLKLWNRGMTKGWTDEGHLTSVISWQICWNMKYD